jgi:hypothetical protein
VGPLPAQALADAWREALQPAPALPPPPPPYAPPAAAPPTYAASSSSSSSSSEDEHEHEDDDEEAAEARRLVPPIPPLEELHAAGLTLAAPRAETAAPPPWTEGTRACRKMTNA